MIIFKTKKTYLNKTKLLILFIISNIGLLSAQYTAIPDACFEQNLINHAIDSEGTLDGQVLSADIENVTTLFFDDETCSVTDITGLECFTALEEFRCYNAAWLPDLDLSICPSLKNITFWYSGIETINLTENLQLESIGIYYSNITNIDVSNNTNLNHLSIAYTNLSELDVAENTLLKILGIFDCSLSEIDVSNNTLLETLIVWSNPISNINVNMLEHLSYLDTRNTNIWYLDLTQNPNLDNLKAYNMPNLQYIDIRNGHNDNFYYDEYWETFTFRAYDNPNLSCIYVDDQEADFLSDWLVDDGVNLIEDEQDCPTAGINDSNQDTAIRVFPNPVKANELLWLDATYAVDKVVLYNNLGKKIREFKGAAPYHLQNLTTGVYTLRVFNNKQQEFVSKLVVVE